MKTKSQSTFERLLSPEFGEVISRLRSCEPELTEIFDRAGEPAHESDERRPDNGREKG